MARYFRGELQPERPTILDDDFDVDRELDQNYEGFAGSYRSRAIDQDRPKLSASIRLSVNDPR